MKFTGLFGTKAVYTENLIYPALSRKILPFNSRAPGS